MSDSAVTDQVIPAGATERDGCLWFPTVEDMTAYYHPEMDYLFDPSLRVRPPTPDEASRYAARTPAPEPPPSLPLIPSVPLLPVVGDVEPLPEPEPLAEKPAPAAEAPAEAVPADPAKTAADKAKAAADQAQADSEVALRRWAPAETLPAVPAADGEDGR